MQMSEWHVSEEHRGQHLSAVTVLEALYMYAWDDLTTLFFVDACERQPEVQRSLSLTTASTKGAAVWLDISRPIRASNLWMELVRGPKGCANHSPLSLFIWLAVIRTSPNTRDCLRQSSRTPTTVRGSKIGQHFSL